MPAVLMSGPPTICQSNPVSATAGASKTPVPARAKQEPNETGRNLTPGRPAGHSAPVVGLRRRAEPLGPRRAFYLHGLDQGGPSGSFPQVTETVRTHQQFIPAQFDCGRAALVRVLLRAPAAGGSSGARHGPIAVAHAVPLHRRRAAPRPGDRGSSAPCL